MNQQTKSILNRVLQNIEMYKKSEIDLDYLVNLLEGSINALEEKLPQEFYDAWFSSWSDLEICLAQGKQNIYRDELLIEIEKINSLVMSYISG